jgi:hypothetical protein
MEWNDRLETEYMRYAGGKWDKFGARGGWRTRADWLAARQRWQKSRDVGDRFRDGMSAIRGHTPERGYNKEAHLPTSDGARFHDIRNDARKRAFEYKSGAIDKKALAQLDKDAQFLAKEGSVEWVIVEGARIDKEVRDRLLRMRKEFPNQFRIVQVTREQLRQSLTVAKHLEKVREREAREQKRAAREKAAQLRKEMGPKELASRKKDLARVVNANVQAIGQAREEGKVFPARELTESYKDVRRSQRKIDKMGRTQARELIAGLGLSERQSREMEAYLAERRAAAQEPVTRGIREIGDEARRQAAAEKEIAAAEKEARELAARDLAWQREQERARAAREASGLDPEFLRVLDAVESASHVAPSKEMSREERESIRRITTREMDSRGLHRGLER